MTFWTCWEKWLHHKSGICGIAYNFLAFGANLTRGSSFNVCCPHIPSLAATCVCQATGKPRCIATQRICKVRQMWSSFSSSWGLWSAGVILRRPTVLVWVGISRPQHQLGLSSMDVHLPHNTGQCTWVAPGPVAIWECVRGRM